MKKQKRNMNVTAPAQKVKSLADAAIEYLQPLGFNSIGRDTVNGWDAYEKKSGTYANFSLMVFLCGVNTIIARIKRRQDQPGLLKVLYDGPITEMETPFVQYFSKLG